ncbi:MAG: DNA mismatch repair endonuclease MutL [Pseudomonadota bacterium]
MQRRIQSLPVHLANQIAAGEVVARPASVVKELLENSIDAGADQIELEVEQGGTRLIKVLDNGRGIHRDDMMLAIAPHATSKVYSQQELEQVISLGFRGEALASIASVSRFKLSSHLEGAEQGWELEVDKEEPVPSPLPRGTLVEVRDLFHNTPARRKFLRTERTEFLHIEDVLKNLALSRFDIAFTLYHNGRRLLRLRQADDAHRQDRRVGELLGRNFANQAVKLDFEAAGMRLWGWLARPAASHSQADKQHFFLNGRMIRDKLINHAVRQAHQSVLEPGRHPAYVLYLEVDPKGVDVNVHPTKHEVRFRESRLVHDFIHRTLLNALAQEVPNSETLPLEQGSRGRAPIFPGEGAGRHASTSARRAIAEQRQFYRTAAVAGAGANRAESEPLFGKARAILHQAYLLTECAGEPVLLDIQAVRHNLLRRHFEQMLADGEVRSQPLIIPQNINLTVKEVDLLVGAGEEYTRLGFEIERLGEESVVIRRIPSLLRGVEPEILVNELLAQVKQQQESQAAEFFGLIAVLVDRAVAATPIKDLGEAERLLRQVEALPEQGRDFWRPLTLVQLQQWFSRGGPV